MHRKLDEDRIKELRDQLNLKRRDNPFDCFTEKHGGKHDDDATHDPDFQ